jgi:hypothetical protein
MNNPYTFQTNQFGISTNTIDLLRNRFPYKSIPINSITSIDIKKGKDLKNWWWVLAIGFALTLYALWDITQILGILSDENIHRVDVYRLVVPAIPLMLGLYSIIIASRNTKVMIIKANDRSYYLSLRDLVKQQQFDPFISYLQSRFAGVNIIY